MPINEVITFNKTKMKNVIFKDGSIIENVIAIRIYGTYAEIENTHGECRSFNLGEIKEIR